jgi:hypothetical protein
MSNITSTISDVLNLSADSGIRLKQKEARYESRRMVRCLGRGQYGIVQPGIVRKEKPTARDRRRAESKSGWI